MQTGELLQARQERESGKNVFTTEQLKTLIDAAYPTLKAAILLGINAGFGNTDCSALPIAAVDLEAGVIDFERPKTAVRRVVPLWPETLEALKIVMNTEQPRPANATAAELVFRTECGFPLVRQIVKSGQKDEIKKVTYIDRLGDWFDELLQDKKFREKASGSARWGTRSEHGRTKRPTSTRSTAPWSGRSRS